MCIAYEKMALKTVVKICGDSARIGSAYACFNRYNRQATERIFALPGIGGRAPAGEKTIGWEGMPLSLCAGAWVRVALPVCSARHSYPCMCAARNVCVARAYGVLRHCACS